MSPGAPVSITLLFVFTFIAVYAWLINVLAISQGRKALLPLAAISLWLILQAILSWKGFYHDNMTIPPHFLLAIGPPLLFVFLLIVFWRKRKQIITLPLLPLILVHCCRLPVEIVLWGLFKAGLEPRLMTFEGGNLDILSGITAPVIGYLWLQKKISNKGLLAWNFAALALLFNIVIRAALSAKTPFQQLAFNQPNVGVTYFPFIWLPTFIVPVVLFCHLTVIYELWRRQRYPDEIVAA